MKIRNAVLNLLLVDAIIIILFLGHTAINSILNGNAPSVQSEADAASALQNELQDYAVLGPQQFVSQKELGTAVEDLPKNDKSSSSSTTNSRPKGTSKPSSSSKGSSQRPTDMQALGTQPAYQPSISPDNKRDSSAPLQRLLPRLTPYMLDELYRERASRIAPQAYTSCTKDSDCIEANNEICNQGLGFCIDLDDGQVPGIIQITNISPSICNGELVDITVRGVYPVKYSWATNKLGSWFATFLSWTGSCFTSYGFSNWELKHHGQTFFLDLYLVENDFPDLYDYDMYDDIIAEAVIFADTTIGIDDNGDNSQGSCIALPFEYTFRNVDLGPFASETAEGNTIEVWIGAIGYPEDQLIHRDDIADPLFVDDSWVSNDSNVDVIDGDCGFGACCDLSTCSFRLSSHKCEDDVQTDYGCPDGTNLGDDVGVQTADRYCSGTSSSCDGSFVWGGWSVYDDCNSNEICINDNPNCQYVECSSNSDCGTDAWLNSNYCSGDNVWDTYRTYTCSNPGTPSASCSNSDNAQLKQTCADTCVNGSCAGIMCYNNADCGTDSFVGSNYCNGDDVWNTWRTHTCNNPGTASASCTYSDSFQLRQPCPDTCQGGSCVTIDCYNNAECGTDSWVGSDYCNGDDVWNTWRTYTCSNPGTPSSSCSSSDNAQLKQTCGDTCSGGSCVGIECYNNAECGTDGWLSNDYCNGNDVWDAWRTWTCNNPGTASASCSYADNNQSKEICPDTCQTGSCVIIECSSDSECGTDNWVGSDYCNADDVWNTWRTWTCNNPGTASASCSYLDNAQLKQDCGAATCTAGTCDIICYNNADCGTDSWIASDYCNGDDVWNTWRTWTCNSPGTPSSSCSSSDNAQLKETCVDTCASGVCQNQGYLWHDDFNHNTIYKLTTTGTVVDSFNSPGYGPHGLTWDGAYLWCADNTDDKIYKLTSDGSVADSFNSPGAAPTGLTWDGTYLWNADAGDDKIYKLTTTGAIQDSFDTPGPNPRGLAWDGTYLWYVDGFNEIFKLTTTGTTVDSFNSPGLFPDGLTWDGTYLWVAVESTDTIYKITTDGTVLDSFGSVDNTPQGLAWQPASQEIECYNNAECGTDNWVGSDYCNADDVWNTWRTWTCNNPGTPSSSCSFSDAAQLKQDCGAGTCTAGSCDIACYNNADCGTDGWLNSDYCNVDDVWDTWRTWTCTDPGTASASCSNSDNAQLKQTCTDTCLGGSCVGIECYSNSECGTDNWVGSDYCNADDVWNTWRTWTCNNPGTASASCSYLDNGQLKLDCAETCESGMCKNDGFLWVVGYSGKKIYKLTTTGTIVDSFDSPYNYPGGLAWDGGYLWNADFDIFNVVDKIYKLTTNGTAVNDFNPPGINPKGLAWDGTYLWNADSSDKKIYKLTTTGTVLGSFDSPGTSPTGLTWDGIYLWNADYTNDTIYKLTTTGIVIDSFDSPGPTPWGLTWDGTYLWHTDLDTDKIYVLTTSGEVLQSFDAPDASSSGLAWQRMSELVECYDDSYCEPDSWLNAYCNGGNVWDTFRDWTCVNPGTPSSSCSYTDNAQLIETCVDTCENGVCKNEGYLWNADANTDKIYKLMPNGTIIDSFDAPDSLPTGLAWDGTYLWYLDQSTDKKMYKMKTNGEVITNCYAPSSYPSGLTSDGTYLWSADSVADKIYKLTGCGQQSSFDSPGAIPRGLAWDGTNLWHVDSSTNKIYKLTTDGVVLDSFDSPGPSPYALTYDGTYLWNADVITYKIYKLTTDGTVVGTFDAPGTKPYGLTWQPLSEIIECYDTADCGTDGWIVSDYCNAGDVWNTYRTYTCNNPAAHSSSCSYSDNTRIKETCLGICENGMCKNDGYFWIADYGDDIIYKLMINGTVVGSFDSPGPNPTGLTWDGAYLWNSDRMSNKIYKLTTNGTAVHSFNAPGNPNPPYPVDLAYYNSYLWNGDRNNDKIYRVSVADGTPMFSFNPPGIFQWGLTWDGTYLWNSDTSADKIYKLTTTGTIVDSFDSPSGNVRGLTWDGTYLWALDDTLYKLTNNGTILDSFDFISWNLAGLAWQPMDELIECYDDGYCDEDEWLNNTYCSVDDVWDTWRNWSCVNPATPSSACTYTDVGQPREICVDTCDEGACIDVDDPAVWNALSDKNVDEDSADGTMIYAGLKTECTDIDTPIFITITPPHAHYDLYFDGNDLKIMNMEQNWYGTEPVTLYCNGVSASFDLTVNNLNDAPALDPMPDITVNETELVQVVPLAVDPDNDTLTYSFESPLNALGEWQTTYADAGIYNLDVTVDDGNGETDTQTVTITVLDVLLPDLIIKSSQVLTPAPTAGSWTTFQIIIENIGDFIASDAYWLFDTDSAEDNPSYGPFDLEAGKTVDIYPAVKYTSAGTYNPVFTVDYNNAIEERDETNNQVTIPVMIS